MIHELTIESKKFIFTSRELIWCARNRFESQHIDESRTDMIHEPARWIKNTKYLWVMSSHDWRNRYESRHIVKSQTDVIHELERWIKKQKSMSHELSHDSHNWYESQQIYESRTKVMHELTRWVLKKDMYESQAHMIRAIDKSHNIFMGHELTWYTNLHVG